MTRLIVIAAASIVALNVGVALVAIIAGVLS
jgi:hypothetical protein